ncbi:MAG TPA: hypothetical protein VEV17_12570 [Bryobacteraceae bacterium]|nr:hypothetical protein [Bryobacteraceae bacterium]
MTLKRPVRRVGSVGFALVFMLVISTNGAAQTQSAASFTATTANLTAGAGEKLKIELFRWSSDQERAQLLAALKESGPEQLSKTLEAAPSAGYVWTDESLGYAVHYACRQPLPNGGERIILAIDRPLGSWSGHPWTARAGSSSGNYPFTVIELRLNSSGRGEGRMSLNAKVAASDADKTIELEDAEATPVLLKNVQREGGRPKN